MISPEKRIPPEVEQGLKNIEPHLITLFRQFERAPPNSDDRKMAKQQLMRVRRASATKLRKFREAGLPPRSRVDPAKHEATLDGSARALKWLASAVKEVTDAEPPEISILPSIPMGRPSAAASQQGQGAGLQPASSRAEPREAVRKSRKKAAPKIDAKIKKTAAKKPAQRAIKPGTAPRGKAHVAARAPSRAAANVPYDLTGDEDKEPAQSAVPGRGYLPHAYSQQTNHVIPHFKPREPALQVELSAIPRSATPGAQSVVPTPLPSISEGASTKTLRELMSLYRALVQEGVLTKDHALDHVGTIKDLLKNKLLTLEALKDKKHDMGTNPVKQVEEGITSKEDMRPPAKEAAPAAMAPPILEFAQNPDTDTDLDTPTGAGLPNERPPVLRKALADYGEWIITKYRVVRVPLAAAITVVGNVASAGKLKSEMKKRGHDFFFHLFSEVALQHPDDPSKKMVLLIEKNQKVTVKTNRPGGLKVSRNEQGFDLTQRLHEVWPMATRPLRFGTWISNGEAYSARHDEPERKCKLYVYDLKTCNCQFFTRSLYRGSDMGDAAVDAFTMQDTEGLLQSWLYKGARKITNLAARLQTIWQGAGGPAEGGVGPEDDPSYPWRQSLRHNPPPRDPRVSRDSAPPTRRPHPGRTYPPPSLTPARRPGAADRVAFSQRQAETMAEHGMTPEEWSRHMLSQSEHFSGGADEEHAAQQLAEEQGHLVAFANEQIAAAMEVLGSNPTAALHHLQESHLALENTVMDLMDEGAPQDIGDAAFTLFENAEEQIEAVIAASHRELPASAAAGMPSSSRKVSGGADLSPAQQAIISEHQRAQLDTLVWSWLEEADALLEESGSHHAKLEHLRQSRDTLLDIIDDFVVNHGAREDVGVPALAFLDELIAEAQAEVPPVEQAHHRGHRGAGGVAYTGGACASQDGYYHVYPSAQRAHVQSEIYRRYDHESAAQRGDPVPRHMLLKPRGPTTQSAVAPPCTSARRAPY